MRVRKVLLAVLVILMVIIGNFASATLVSAGNAPEDGGKDGDPQCAVIGGGPIHCSGKAGIDPQSDKCYVINPYDKDPVKRKQFEETDCQGQTFLRAKSRGGVISCEQAATEQKQSPQCDQGLVCNGERCDLMQKYGNPAIKALAALVGVGAVLAIIISGIQYSASRDSPQAVAEARRRIGQALVVLLMLAVFLAFLNWLIPGGIGLV